MQTASYALAIANLTINSLSHITLGFNLPILHHSGLSHQTTLWTVTRYFRHFIYRRHLAVNQYSRSDWLMDFKQSDRECKLPRIQTNKMANVSSNCPKGDKVDYSDLPLYERPTANCKVRQRITGPNLHKQEHLSFVCRY